MKTLASENAAMQDKLREILSQQEHLCVTADVWSSRAQSYLGVTVHFLNSEHKRESYVLAFKQFFTKQTYKELASAMDKIFEDYGIKKNQIRNIVTDGGSNFCKMFKIYGQSIDATVTTYDAEPEAEADDDCENGDHQPFVSEILTFDSSSDKEVDLLAVEEGAYCEDLESYFGNTNSVPEDDRKIEMPPQRRCVSHILNRLSHDFEHKYLNSVPKKALCQTISKLQSLWVLVHRSTNAKAICKRILGKVLLVQNDTRWNSRYDAIKMCTEPDIQKNLNKLISELKSELKCVSAQNLQVLTVRDFAIMESYIKVFEPVAIALDVMQREFNSSQGYIIPVLASMKSRIENIKEMSNNKPEPLMKDFKSAMLQAINFRFTSYFLFDVTNKDLLLASVTLPNIKTNFIKDDDDIIFTKNLLVAECLKMKKDKSDFSTTQQAPTSVQEDSFIISYSKLRDIRRRSIESEIESEVARYLCDNRNEISILNEYPNVRAVYFKYNTTISSSAPVERVFSQSLMIFTPRRNQLNALHFEQTLLNKHNRKLLTESKRIV